MPGIRSLVLGRNSNHKTFKLRLGIEEVALFRTHFTTAEAKDQSIHVNPIRGHDARHAYLALIWY